VTVCGVLLILSGGLTAWLDPFTTPFPGSPPIGATPRQRMELEAVIDEAEAFEISFASQLGSDVGRLVGATGCLSGVGILLLQPWARLVAMWQAGASLLVWLWWVWLAPPLLQSYLHTGLRLAATSGEQARWQEALRMSAVTEWVGFLYIAAWNALIIWFFLRPSVRAEFEAKQPRAAGG
jgi:hypothetical protein